MTAQSGRAVLILGHPSHEVRVFTWMLKTKPVVSVLTDGSANRGFRVCEHTASYLQERGIPLGSMFGAFPDRQFYAHILSQDFQFFRSVSRHLAEELCDESVGLVAGDSIEGFNPTHDICRLLIDAAVLIARLKRKQPLANYEFTLVGPVKPKDKACDGASILVTLTDEERGQKIEFAKVYPGVAEDVARQLAAHGAESFGEEFLYPSDESRLFRPLFHDKPPYELYGEMRVLSGFYSSVLRYSEHVRPIQEDLCRFVEAQRGSA
jgi:hypothetical protein